MVKAGLIPKLVELLKRPPYRARGLRLLYHMSIDDRCKAMFAYTDVSHDHLCFHSVVHHLAWRFEYGGQDSVCRRVFLRQNAF